MDALVQEAIRKVDASVKTDVPWQPDIPFSQAVHYYQDDQWMPAHHGDARRVQTDHTISTIAVYSWNIDFMLPYATSRMRLALGTLEGLVASRPSTSAIVIYLQECLLSDLELLAATPWIQQHFFLTDLDYKNWASAHYGTVTLIDHRLSISACFRVHYAQTRMQRDALCVDVELGKDGNKKVRFCNTHLESLAMDPPLRPAQVAIAAKYLREPGVHGAAMAGDFNAIQPFDRHLHSDNGLKDAYLELGGNEDSDEGYTWGQQAATESRGMFGCSRMDKVFFTGGLRLKSFERFGAGVELKEEVERDHVVNLGFDRPWITDHLGVIAMFGVEESEGGGKL
jgi:tyrosyl-DNA phosphodiesterase 2